MMKPSYMKKALLFSVVLNLFFASYFFSTHFWAEQAAPATITVLRQAIRELSPQGQDAFKEAFLGNGGLILETKDAMAQKRLSMLKKIGEAEFNQEELAALMAETADLTRATQKGMQALFLQAIMDLSVEDRKKLSDSLVKNREYHTNFNILKKEQ